MGELSISTILDRSFSINVMNLQKVKFAESLCRIGKRVDVEVLVKQLRCKKVVCKQTESERKRKQTKQR